MQRAVSSWRLGVEGRSWRPTPTISRSSSTTAIGASQLGYLDCTASPDPQNIVWEIMNGCPPLYGPHPFDNKSSARPANNLYTLPYPGNAVERRLATPSAV